VWRITSITIFFLQKWRIPPIAMVYDTQNYTVHGRYKTTNITVSGFQQSTMAIENPV
jgi:YbbR domain-containing protein